MSFNQDNTEVLKYAIEILKAKPEIISSQGKGEPAAKEVIAIAEKLYEFLSTMR